MAHPTPVFKPGGKIDGHSDAIIMINLGKCNRTPSETVDEVGKKMLDAPPTL
jgi:hypothetical protein